MASIWRSRAFISAARQPPARRGPSRGRPWSPQTSSSRSFSASASPFSARSSAMSRTRPCDVGLAEQRRRLAHQHRAGAEGLEHQAERGQLVGRAPATRSASAGSSSTTSGISSAWRATPPLGHRGLHPLVDQPLVGGVLVDDDHAVAGLGDDVGLVHLGPRRAQRIVDAGRTTGAGVALGDGRTRRRGSAVPKPAAAAARRGDRRDGRCQPPAPGASSRRRRGGAACRPEAAQRRAGTVVEARWPAPASAWRRAPTIRPRTRPGSRKRTSALAGWTLTSTMRRSSSRNSAASGWRSRARKSA